MVFADTDRASLKILNHICKSFLLGRDLKFSLCCYGQPLRRLLILTGELFFDPCMRFYSV